MPKGSNIRQRDVGAKYVGKEYWEWIYPNKPFIESYVEIPGRQYTVSEGHAPSRDGKYREGGPFYTIRASSNVRPSILNPSAKLFGSLPIRFEGPCWVAPDYIDVSDKGLSSFRSQDLSDLDPDGATAVALCSPVNPVANLGTGLAEAFREGMPSIPGVHTWKSRLGILKNAASEFLNVEFGWLPLVNEVHDVRDASSHSSKIIQQYERDANRQVRRGFSYPVEKSESTTKYADYPAVGGGNFANYLEPGLRPETTRTEKVVRERWFEGAFIHPPLGASTALQKVTNAGTEASKLYGLDLTPSLLWELTPWSWAIDYFSNAGQVMTNVTNFTQYGQIMRYGYMMEEKTIEITKTMTPIRISNDHGENWYTVTLPPSQTIIKSKVRAPANPYGFGVSWEGLSPTQIAILAAVGITLL